MAIREWSAHVVILLRNGQIHESTWTVRTARPQHATRQAAHMACGKLPSGSRIKRVTVEVER